MNLLLAYRTGEAQVMRHAVRTKWCTARVRTT